MGRISPGAGGRAARGPARRWWLAVVLPLALAAAVVGAAMGYLALMGRDPVRDAGALLDPPFHGREQVAILLIGLDEAGEPYRSDTLLLGTFDLGSDYAAMISIPRDLRLEIPGHGIQKINAAYPLGGVDLVKRTVTQRFGVPIDYTVAITIPALEQMVDALGGVEINVERRMRYRDRRGHLSIDLQPGKQRLDGKQALGYVRFRHDAAGDLARIGRQQNFIRQVASQATASGQWRHLPKLIDLFLKNVDTDLTVKDMMALGEFARRLDPDSIRSATLPGRAVMAGGISYLDPDWPAIAALLRDLAWRQGEWVEVLHGDGLEAAGEQVARRLEAHGFRVARVAPAWGGVDHTEVIPRGGASSGAARIGRLLQCGTGPPRPRADSEEVEITVLVGSDYAGLRGRRQLD